MDKTEYIQRRARRKMAQLLDQFEREVEPWVPADAAERFKREVRRKVNALATDAQEVIELTEDTELNGVAIQIRDRIGATRA